MSTIDDFVVTADEPQAAPDPAAAGASQRLRIHVPNISTTLSMGAMAGSGDEREEDLGTPNYPGFGVDTLGHIFADAHGGKDVSRMTLQANGMVHIQSDQDSLYMVSSGPAVLATPTVANIVGGAGVVIGAGPWAAPPSNLRSSGEGAGPMPPESVAEVPHHLETAAKWWLGVDGSMAAIAIAATVLQTRFANPMSPAALAWVSAKNLANVAAAGCVANNGYGLASGHELIPGGVTMYGTTGLIAGTPAWAGIYGGLGLTLGSLFPTMVALMEAAIISANKMSLTSRKEITMTGGHEVTVLAGHKVEIASKHGGVGIKAKEVVIGSKDAPGGQHMTDAVAIYGDKTVGIASKEKMRLSAKQFGISSEDGVFNGKRIAIGAEDKVAVGGKEVAVKAGQTVSLSTDKYFLNIDGSSLKLGNVSSPIPAEPQRKPPDYDARLRLLASDTPMQDLRALEADEEQSWVEEWMSWADKAGAIEAKNCSVELKDGDITFEVHGFKMKIDSTQTAIANTLKIMK